MTSAPASAATSISCNARSTEPLWLTPASAMIQTRSDKFGLHHVERFVQQTGTARQRSKNIDDAARREAVAIGVHSLPAVEQHGASDRLTDGSAFAGAMQHRGGREPSALPFPDIDARNSEGRR